MNLNEVLDKLNFVKGSYKGFGRYEIFDNERTYLGELTAFDTWKYLLANKYISNTNGNIKFLAKGVIK